MSTTFHSLLAQSQSLSDLKLVERWLQAMSIMAQMNPNAIRKVDVFKIADEYARRLDIDTSLVVPTDVIEEQMAAEAEAQQQAQQAQMQAEALKAMGSATKDFAEAGTIAQQEQGVL
jgi:regulator of protease activity HflC (stomatin/prohibitin superfamily)